ncbi:MAG: hypothetical protein FWF24_06170 [Alphaproteobacteria bacterium]|nr:hypothetical protein [Alphaproteobacteria bacterium]
MTIFGKTKEEIEAWAAEATRKAQEEIHAKGLPYVIGDNRGMFKVYPDGRKVFVPYSKDQTCENG